MGVGVLIVDLIVGVWRISILTTLALCNSSLWACMLFTYNTAKWVASWCDEQTIERSTQNITDNDMDSRQRTPQQTIHPSIQHQVHVHPLSTLLSYDSFLLCGFTTYQLELLASALLLAALPRQRQLVSVVVPSSAHLLPHHARSQG